MTTSQLGMSDRVRFKQSYLQSLPDRADTISFLTGEIVKVKKYAEDFAIATVQWDSEPGRAGKRQRVNLEHLEKVT